MELLKIENGVAKYWNDNDYHDIKEIGRSDLLAILAEIYKNDDAIIVSAQTNTEEIKDPAARIIFDDILNKLNDFNEKRDELRNDIDSIFKDIETQYKDDLLNES